MDLIDQPSWEKIESVLDAVLDVAPELRKKTLRNLCGGDRTLQARVAELIQADDCAGEFLSRPSPLVIDALYEDLAGNSPSRPAVPGRVGPYKIVDELGQGGMGVVYLAERDDGEFEQRVALKCIGPTVISPDLQKRFRQERSILARLEHPNIARLLDGGVTAGGIPYFAMEYVDGEPITDYCARHKLDVDRRIDLFLDVCRAVEAAHSRLIVHRDLKPSNILVNSDGQVKLLDFGVAKLVEQERDGLTPSDKSLPAMLTPAYAAPEQLAGDPATAATDVFALGLVLYELLTTKRPFSPDGSDIAATAEAHKTTPTPPSVRAAAARASAGSGSPVVAVPRPGTLDAADLDAICLKAMHTEQSERYSSAETFRRELVRLRMHLPVEARKGNSIYLLRKLLRRNRVEFVAASAVVLALTIGALVAMRQATVARSERDRAQAAQLQADTLNQFLVSEMLSAAAPEASQGRRVTVQDVLDAASRRVEFSFVGQPVLEATVRLTLGRTYASLGEYDQADVHLAGAVNLLRTHRGDDAAETLRARTAFAALQIDRGEQASAAEELNRIHELQGTRLGREHLDTLATDQVLADLAVHEGRYLDAEQQLVRLVQSLERSHPDAWEPRSKAMTLLANTLQLQRKNTEAEAVCRAALELQRKHLGADHPQTLQAQVVLGWILSRLERVDEAVAGLEDAVSRHERVLGKDHRLTLEAINALGRAYWGQDRTQDALAIYLDTVERAKRSLGETHPYTIVAIRNLALAYDATGHAEQAEKFHREGVRLSRLALGDLHQSSIKALKNLGMFLMGEGRTDEALKIFRETAALGQRLAAQEEADPTALNDMAWFLLTAPTPQVRDPQAALPLAERAVELTHRRQAEFLDSLAAAYDQNGDLPRAVATQREALALPDSLSRFGMEKEMLRLLEESGDDAGAEEFLRWNLGRRRKHLPQTDPAIGETLRLLGQHAASTDRNDDAERWFREALAQFGSNPARDGWRLCRAQSQLGEFYVRIGRNAPGIQLLEDAVQCMQPHAEQRRALTRELVERLATAKEALGLGQRGDEATGNSPDAPDSRSLYPNFRKVD